MSYCKLTLRVESKNLDAGCSRVRTPEGCQFVSWTDAKFAKHKDLQ